MPLLTRKAIRSRQTNGRTNPNYWKASLLERIVQDYFSAKLNREGKDNGSWINLESLTFKNIRAKSRNNKIAGNNIFVKLSILLALKMNTCKNNKSYKTRTIQWINCIAFGSLFYFSVFRLILLEAGYSAL